MDNEHKILLKTTRSGFDDEIYYGSYYIFKDNKIQSYYGKHPKNICFMRSVAKPIQASVMCDYNIISDYKLKSSDIALFMASHAGSPTHIKHLKEIMAKHNLKISSLELAKAKPLDIRIFKGKKTKLHNNCSAKHIMMLIMCKYLSLELKNYTNPNHRLQKLIHKKQNELTNFKSEILTYDGCGTPLWGLPFENVLIGYNNLIKNHEILFNCAIKHPYLFGGFERFDTEIIKLGKGNLFAKVGAGGFVIIYNKKEDMFLMIKMAQNNNSQRRLVALNMLNKLNWISTEITPHGYNQKQQKVCTYNFKSG